MPLQAISLLFHAYVGWRLVPALGSFAAGSALALLLAGVSQVLALVDPIIFGQIIDGYTIQPDDVPEQVRVDGVLQLLALAVALFAVAPLLQGLTFALGLRRIGAGGSAGALARMWARSFLLRYEPSGVVGFAYRVTARERVGASTAQVMTVTGYEQLAVVVAGQRSGRARLRSKAPVAEPPSDRIAELGTD